MPRVSVLVSHYDRRRCLLQALDSIAAQTWRDFEVVVVSDAGPEASRTLVDAFAAAHRGAFDVRFVHRAVNGGVAAARNTAVAEARGTLLAWLDDDDLWRPDHLAALVRACDAGAVLAYGDAEIFRMEPAGGPGGPGGPGGGFVAGRAGELDPAQWRVAERRVLAVPFAADDLARDDFIVPGGMLHAKALVDEIGAFDETLFVSDDWDWLLRLHAARGAAAFVRVPRIVVDVRIWGAGANLSADFGARRRAALDTLERRHGTPPLEPKTFWEVAGTYAARGTDTMRGAG